MAPASRLHPFLAAAAAAAAAVAAAAAAAAAATAQTVRYNVGGGALPRLSPPWAALPPGALRGASYPRSAPPAPVLWTTADAVYTTWRESPPGAQWGVRLPVPAAGTYTVTLHWAEMGAAAAPRRRVFHVAVGADGAAPRPRLWAVDAGYRPRAAVRRLLAGVAAASSITVEVLPQTGSPFLSGVTLTRTGGGGTSTPQAAPAPKPSPARVRPRWRPAPGAPPQAKRHENGFAVAQGRLYLLGGRDRRPVNAYDPATGAWSWGRPPPMQMHHFQAVAAPDGRSITVGMGWTGGFPREANLRNLWSYTPATDRWAAGPRIPPARARGGGGAVVYRGVYYFVNGNRGGHGAHAVSLPWFDSYDPSTGVWRVLPDAPVARDHVHAAVVRGELVVAGGRDGGVADFWSATTTAVTVYNFASRRWRTLPVALRNGRGGAAVAAVANRYVVVTGGEVPGGVVPTTEVLDMQTGL